MRTRVKICCVASLEEAGAAVSLGADALGLVGDMPSGPGVIDDELARVIAAATPPPVGTFLLTSHTWAAEIARQVFRCGTNTVQIVRHLDPAEYPRLIKLLPAAVRRVQVIHVEDHAALEQIAVYAPYVHAFLLDSGRPSAPVPELGGTGRVHNWEVSAQFVRRSPVPVFLAGGLRWDNVAQAIATVRPYGLDVCSGVRTAGQLDPEKLVAFMDEVAKADQSAVSEGERGELNSICGFLSSAPWSP